MRLSARIVVRAISISVGSALISGLSTPSLPADAAKSPASIVFYAASSLTSALTELGADFTVRTSVRVVLSFGNSASLAKQIEWGAPADGFLSASPQWMDYLEQKGLIDTPTRADLVGNRLVIVAPRGEGFKVLPTAGFDFPGAFKGRLAVGDPTCVPAGIYARQAMQRLGWWGALKDRLAPGQDVRAALAYVERGECAAGIVYATDARASVKVEVLALLPEESHDRILYPAAAVKGRGNGEVRRFLDFLRSGDARETFGKLGFVPLGEGP